MVDFEVHPRGTVNSHIEEIRLSRALARAIEEEIASYGNVVPYSVLTAYNNLKSLYERQIEEGIS